jgi:pectin methylesterase-like acyl-CoA thioesterase
MVSTRRNSYWTRLKSIVVLIGENKFNTILTYDDHTGKVSPKGDTISTPTSASFFMQANDFTAQNITFQNDAGFTAGQAVAIRITGDRARFFECRFVGNRMCYLQVNPTHGNTMSIVILKEQLILFSVHQYPGLNNVISTAKKILM